MAGAPWKSELSVIYKLGLAGDDSHVARSNPYPSLKRLGSGSSTCLHTTSHARVSFLPPAARRRSPSLKGQESRAFKFYLLVVVIRAARSTERAAAIQRGRGAQWNGILEGHQRRAGANAVVVASSCKHTEGASREAGCWVSLARSNLARKQQGGRHSGASLSSSAT